MFFTENKGEICEQQLNNSNLIHSFTFDLKKNNKFISVKKMTKENIELMRIIIREWRKQMNENNKSFTLKRRNSFLIACNFFCDKTKHKTIRENFYSPNQIKSNQINQSNGNNERTLIENQEKHWKTFSLNHTTAKNKSEKSIDEMKQKIHFLTSYSTTFFSLSLPKTQKIPC